MFEVAGAVVTLGLAGLAGVVWLVRLEGRLNVLKALYEGLKERVNGFEERIYLILERIEQKLDHKADRE